MGGKETNKPECFSERLDWTGTEDLELRQGDTIFLHFLNVKTRLHTESGLKVYGVVVGVCCVYLI